MRECEFQIEQQGYRIVVWFGTMGARRDPYSKTPNEVAFEVSELIKQSTWRFGSDVAWQAAQAYGTPGPWL